MTGCVELGWITEKKCYLMRSNLLTKNISSIIKICHEEGGRLNSIQEFIELCSGSS